MDLDQILKNFNYYVNAKTKNIARIKKRKIRKNKNQKELIVHFIFNLKKKNNNDILMKINQI